MSADGMLLESELPLEVGAGIGLGLHLIEPLQSSAGLDYLHFDLEVLERNEVSGTEYGTFRYRCRNLTPPGSEAYERAQRVVMAASNRA